MSKDLHEYQQGHKTAVDHGYGKKYDSTGKESPHFKAGYKQGATQAHNLRAAIKEHELPPWAKD